MPSLLNQAMVTAMWPSLLPVLGESITHDSAAAAAALATTLVFDDGAVIQEKGARVAALISGPSSSFAVVPPLERDLFTRESDGKVYVCVEVEDDKIGGWKCWCRLKSA